MSGRSDYTVLSLASVSALARTDQADFELYLPGKSADEPVLYSRTDSNLTASDFKRLSESGLSRVLVRTDSFDKSARMVESNLENMLNNPDISPVDKAELFHTVGSTVARDMVSDSVTPDHTRRTSKVVEAMIDHVLRDSNVGSHLLQMAGHERSTASHMFFVSTFAIILGAQAFGEDEDTLHDLGFAGMLHDIGKLSIPPDILNKPARLTREELHYIQQHPIESVRLIGDDPLVSLRARQVILQHHERLDGRGYPLALNGAALLAESKVLSIVDSFHAMIGARRYRAPMMPHDALRVLAAQSGKQFDGELVDHWRQVFGQFYVGVFDGHELRSVPADELSSHHEHRPGAAAPKRPRERLPRRRCEGRTVVHCRYAGRLIDATCAPGEFGASVRDISQAGMCIHVPHPMYRGEILHLRVPIDRVPAWVRGAVAWCAAQDDGTFRIGVRFIERIAEDVVDKPADVVALGELTPSPGAGEADDHAADQPARTRRRRDMEALAAIDCLRRPDPRAQSTAVALAMSGDWEVRLRAVEVLANMRTLTAQKGLIALLDDKNPEIRERAVGALADVRCTAAIPNLRAMLHDPVDRIAIRAAGALGKIGDDSGLSRVLAALGHNGPASRWAAQALGDIIGRDFPPSQEGAEAARRYVRANNLASVA